MVEIIITNGILIMNGTSYQILSMNLRGETIAYVHIYNDIYNEIIGLLENETTINGVLQTSAQMIIDTLTNA
jgi:hypothetical protein